MFIVALEIIVYNKILRPVYDLTNEIRNPKKLNYSEIIRRSTPDVNKDSSSKALQSQLKDTNNNGSQYL